MARADFSASRADAQLAADAPTMPLLAEVGRIFVPLMVQNADAWQRAVAEGETLFNGAAFDAGRSLFDGELAGRPSRSVVNTFQVRV